MKIRGNRALVYIDSKKDELSSGGVILPKEGRGDSDALIGEIIAVGLGDEVGDLYASQGKKVLFPSYAGTKYKVFDKEYVIINSSDILAIIDEDDDDIDK